MRNNRNKRKRIFRAEKRKAADILRQKEQAEYSHAKELARFSYGKWKDLGRQNKSRALDHSEFVDRCARLPLHNKYANVNIIDPAELCPPNGNEILLGEGSYGHCLLRHYKRLNIKVVEKQSLLHDTKEILKEAHIMQALSHKNIPTILGVQIQKSPMSLVIEFIGEHDTSITLSKLLSCDNYQEAACHSSFPPAKKYSISYSHIAPEVLKCSPCSKASDIFSLGKILYKIGTRFEIPVLVSTAQKCLDANPARRPTNTGIMATTGF
ncbi:hypothetical protein P5673_019020 [Acropora cervicornis]|uniref:Serine-threonine/tyrosine-protein kinase catalytic domain-containing protein n=1 Tax=Acropora cervicornis TaxID=6130 RepID=A0AAD9QDC4_ACRCE|nr:hypothetical protein P5673_019020 [Acropora cervicornis]